MLWIWPSSGHIALIISEFSYIYIQKLYLANANMTLGELQTGSVLQ
jgi:hypothetical protein